MDVPGQVCVDSVSWKILRGIENITGVWMGRQARTSFPSDGKVMPGLPSRAVTRTIFVPPYHAWLFRIQRARVAVGKGHGTWIRSVPGLSITLIS